MQAQNNNTAIFQQVTNDVIADPSNLASVEKMLDYGAGFLVALEGAEALRTLITEAEPLIVKEMEVVENEQGAGMGAGALDDEARTARAREQKKAHRLFGKIARQLSGTLASVSRGAREGTPTGEAGGAAFPDALGEKEIRDRKARAWRMKVDDARNARRLAPKLSHTSTDLPSFIVQAELWRKTHVLPDNLEDEVFDEEGEARKLIVTKEIIGNKILAHPTFAADWQSSLSKLPWASIVEWGTEGRARPTEIDERALFQSFRKEAEQFNWSKLYSDETGRPRRATSAYAATLRKAKSRSMTASSSQASPMYANAAWENIPTGIRMHITISKDDRSSILRVLEALENFSAETLDAIEEQEKTMEKRVDALVDAKLRANNSRNVQHNSQSGGGGARASFAGNPGPDIPLRNPAAAPRQGAKLFFSSAIPPDPSVIDNQKWNMFANNPQGHEDYRKAMIAFREKEKDPENTSSLAFFPLTPGTVPPATPMACDKCGTMGHRFASCTEKPVNEDERNFRRIWRSARSRANPRFGQNKGIRVNLLANQQIFDELYGTTLEQAEYEEHGLRVMLLNSDGFEEQGGGSEQFFHQG